MPDPAAPFMQYAPPLLQMAQNNPMPQAGQTLAQGITQGVDSALNPYQALAKRFGLQPALANTSARPMPVGPGAPPQPPPGAPPVRPGMPPQPGMPGPMIPPGPPMNILPPGYGGR